jgi:hypothetical protein
MGMGKNRFFEIIEILLVPHGGHKNDTIVTVERKFQGRNYKDRLIIAGALIAAELDRIRTFEP